VQRAEQTHLDLAGAEGECNDRLASLHLEEASAQARLSVQQASLAACAQAHDQALVRSSTMSFNRAGLCGS
jgi:hypothetical protein